MWEISVGYQASSFALSMLLGGIICALYDVIRAVRKVCLNSFVAVLFTDILLWVVYAFATFILLMARTNGEIRGYVLFGELVGFIVFRLSVSKLVFPLLSFAFIKIAAIKRKTADVIYRLYIKFEALILKKLHNGFEKIKSMTKSAKKLLKNRHKLLYTNENNISTENVLDETKTEA